MTLLGISDTVSQRALLLPSILAVHAVLLIWIAAEKYPVTAPAKAGSLAVFDVAFPSPPASHATSVAKAAVAPSPVRLPFVSPPLVPINLPLPAATPSVAGACDLTDMVQTGLRADPKVRATLLTIPQEARSVANAIMLWNGHWGAGSSAPSSGAVAEVRQAVRAIVTAAPEECRQTIQAGPRLVTVAGPPDLVLAFGSGRWRWSDLAADEQTEAASSGGPSLPHTDLQATASAAR